MRDVLFLTGIENLKLYGTGGRGDVQVRIANYCSALESLFSNDTTELTHKLSERVSWFIGEDAANRISTFHRVKKA
jgi:hypothetical protein